MRWSFGCDLSSQFGTRLPASEARAGFGLRRSFPRCDKPVSTEFATLFVESNSARRAAMIVAFVGIIIKYGRGPMGIANIMPSGSITLEAGRGPHRGPRRCLHPLRQGRPV
jgi:hypothetical protein